MYNTTKDILLNAVIPQQTRTYKPVTHGELIDLTLNGIEKAGFKLDKELYSTARDGNIANGRFTISNVMDSEMQLEVGWQNSYDKSLSLKFAIGTRIMICQNGCVSGDYGAFKKKHMGEVQIFTPNAITEYIKGAGDVFRRMQIEREAMKQVELTKRTKAELIGRMMLEEQFIQSTQLMVISRELDTPTFDYGAPDSMWELYQFTTQSMREVHPSLWMNNHIKAHNFFVNEMGELSSNIPPVALAEQIMNIAGDTQEDIEAFRQLSMF
jgi:hypothetical protein